jgi:hypothetical protein
MADDGRPQHCERRADEPWPHGPYAYLPRGGICDNGAPRSRRPVAAGSPPAHPAHRAAGQWRSRSDAVLPPGPVRRGQAPGQTAIRRHCRSRDPGLRGGPGPAGRDLNRVSARRAGSVTRHPHGAATASDDVAARRRGRIADMTTLMLSADLAAVWSLPLAGQRATSSLPTMRCGSRASSPQPGAAEQPVLVPLLRWSSPAQVALPAVLRPARRFVPSAGTDPVTGRVVLLEAEPAGWTWQQGPGQRASSVGEPVLAVAGLSGSRTARTLPARPARQASPFRLVEQQQV